jgi:hypothetical protein
VHSETNKTNKEFLIAILFPAIRTRNENSEFMTNGLRLKKKEVVFVFLNLIFSFSDRLYFQKRRGSFIRVMYFNHVLKCPVDLKTKFGMGVLE